ncbi:MAG: hypothetical protein M3033_19600 [Acidobacteriota bacterium]|nr:hypothetical protein [Acidobacteriota bacterium]
MLISKWFLMISLTSLVFSINLRAQTTEADAARQRRQEELDRQRQERDLNDRRQALDTLANSPRVPYIRHSSETKPLTKEERAKIKAILAPDAEDTRKYKDFLRQKNTGLFRLFPDLDCEVEKNVIRADGNCADLIPGSWNYSFRRKNYSTLDFLDVQFKDGNLISKGFISQGILVRLGDVALENILPADSGVKFLLDFKPEARIREAKKQFLQISRGIEAGGYKYTNSLKAETNVTYALRVIAYRNEQKTFSRLTPDNVNLDDLKFLSLEGDKRIDLTVVFRIVRQDENGSLTILWKELNRQESPKLVFAKNEKLSDIK